MLARHKLKVTIASKTCSRSTVTMSDSKPLLADETSDASTYNSTAQSISLDTQEKIAGVQHPEQSISFHDIHYEVRGWRQKSRKVILYSASGLLLPGINAIMGPTGGGKTSLLDILADRKNKSGLTGTVLINGDRQPENFKCSSGYVVQDDIVMGTLTVRENLHFSAALRLPSHLTWKQRKKKVEKVIEDLGLDRCADTKVGTELFRGVSGGERKRTNIGMELIIEPQVLFLDEPTTGLDAHTSVSVIKLLKELSKSANHIIVLSIHQPRYSIFKLFDRLTLLSRGEVVYHGPAQDALGYFDRIGFRCEQYENPADHFLDVITLCENLPSAEVQGNQAFNHAVDLVTSYRQSEQYKHVQEKLQPLLDDLTEREMAEGFTVKPKPVTYATNFFWQLFVVTVRSVVDLWRNPIASTLQILVMIAFALLVGIIYFDIDSEDLKEDNVMNVFSDRIGAFFFILLNQLLGNLSAIDIFIRQKPLFIHENISGFYRVSAFFLAKVSSDLIPMRIIPICFYSLVVYFMVDFQTDVSKFFIFVSSLSLTSISAAALSFAISAGASTIVLATILLAFVIIISMLFGGLLIALESLPVWLKWAQYLSFFRYGMEALAINEISDIYCYKEKNTTSFQCGSLPDNITCTGTDCRNGTTFLENKGFETSTEWLWYDHIALAVIIVFYLSVAYILLRMVKKEK